MACDGHGSPSVSGAAAEHVSGPGVRHDDRHLGELMVEPSRSTLLDAIRAHRSTRTPAQWSEADRALYSVLPETTNTQGLRETLHREEHRELVHELEQAAVGNADLGQIARELADVVYVAYGSAWAFGIDLDAALAEVHRAAMDKMNAGVRRADGKILKPPGFVPPDMSKAIAQASAEPYDGDPLPSADDVCGILADREKSDA
jgi:NTP pyrophosphatase (non-canonical NTP hydrolase)